MKVLYHNHVTNYVSDVYRVYLLVYDFCFYPEFNTNLTQNPQKGIPFCDKNCTKIAQNLQKRQFRALIVIFSTTNGHELNEFFTKIDEE